MIIRQHISVKFSNFPTMLLHLGLLGNSLHIGPKGPQQCDALVLVHQKLSHGNRGVEVFHSQIMNMHFASHIPSTSSGLLENTTLL